MKYAEEASRLRQLAIDIAPASEVWATELDAIADAIDPVLALVRPVSEELAEARRAERASRVLADMLEAHAEGLHDGVPREGCAYCEERKV